MTGVVFQRCFDGQAGGVGGMRDAPHRVADAILRDSLLEALLTIPVVVTSAECGADGALARLAPAAFLQKPFELDELLDVVGRYCPREDRADASRTAACL